MIDFDDVGPFIQEFGQSATLRRPVGTVNRTYIDVAVRTFIRQYQPNELAGGIVQGDRLAIISALEIPAASWPGPPQKGDKLVVGGMISTVQGCETVRIGETIYRYNLQVRGDV